MQEGVRQRPAPARGSKQALKEELARGGKINPALAARKPGVKLSARGKRGAGADQRRNICAARSASVSVPNKTHGLPYVGIAPRCPQHDRERWLGEVTWRRHAITGYNSLYNAGT